MNQPTSPVVPWGEALLRASRSLPADDRGAHLFHEEREDLRIELHGSGGSPRVTLARTRGACARDSGGRLVHRSDPDPDEVAALAVGLRAAADGARPTSLRAWVAIEPRSSLADATSALGLVLELAEQIAKAGARVVTDLSILWVESIQKIWVVHAGSAPRTDVRRGRRLKVVASANGWPMRATVTVDRVFRSDSAPPINDLAEALAKRLRQRLTARPAPIGNHPIVFAPGTGGVVVHELVGHALEADTILRGDSLLFKAGGRVAGELVTVIDDPRRGRTAWRSDDEGHEPTPVALLKDGRVAGAIHDTRSAREMKKGSTGHGRSASYASSVRPRMGCTFLAPGPHDPLEVIESTRSGIHVRRMESAGTDPARGVAHFRVTDADWIEGGRIEAPLDPFLLRARLPEALTSIDRIANDLEFDRCVGSCVRDGQALATSVGAPTFRLRLATVLS